MLWSFWNAFGIHVLWPQQQLMLCDLENKHGIFRRCQCRQNKQVYRLRGGKIGRQSQCYHRQHSSKASIDRGDESWRLKKGNEEGVLFHVHEPFLAVRPWVCQRKVKTNQQKNKLSVELFHGCSHFFHLSCVDAEENSIICLLTNAHGPEIAKAGVNSGSSSAHEPTKQQQTARNHDAIEQDGSGESYLQDTGLVAVLVRKLGEIGWVPQGQTILIRVDTFCIGHSGLNCPHEEERDHEKHKFQPPKATATGKACKQTYEAKRWQEQTAGEGLNCLSNAVAKVALEGDGSQQVPNLQLRWTWECSPTF